MAGRRSHRRTAEYRQRADALAEQARWESDHGRHHYFMGLAAAYRNAAQLLEPQAEASPALHVFAAPVVK
jgi:hypothetical protein